MLVSFYGATQEVTGSFHVLTTEFDNILMDCGLFQGKRKETDAKNRILPIDPAILTNVILSHAHIDHSGRLPMITKEDFRGNIICSRPTVSASEYLLRDAAKIQEGDASYLNYKTAKHFMAKLKAGNTRNNVSADDMKEIKSQLKSNDHEIRDEATTELLQENQLEVITPLYSVAEAEQALSYFQGVPYRSTVTVGKNLTCTFYEAGHILGSAMSVIQYIQGGTTKTILYTGDLGRFNKPIVKDPNLVFAEEHRKIDLMVMESTYGNRKHDPIIDMKPLLKKVVLETYERGGSIIIPAFAYGRTQELIYFLHELYLEKEVPHLPVWVDSPLATNITHVFGEHPETYDEDTHEAFLRKGINPFDFAQLKFVQTIEESMALNRDTRSHIVLAGSGMCEGGRILHHLRYKIHDERNTILIVGYMGENTFGRRLQELGTQYAEEGRKGAPPVVRFYNKEYPLRAHVVTLGGFSAHGDKDELLKVIKESNLEIKKIALVHGEIEQSQGFSQTLTNEGYEVTIPRHGQHIEI